MRLGGTQKLAGTGTTDIEILFLNSGTVSATEGTLNLDNGGIVEGTFSAASAATINWAGGSFAYQNGPLLNGPGTIALTGGSLTLVSNTLANLQLLGGTVNLSTNFQGGTITNLTLPGRDRKSVV